MLNADTVTTIYETYKNIMFHRAYRILRDARLSEDAVQESFAKIWNSRNTLRVDSVDSYRTHALMNIIIDNTAKTMYRQLEKRKSDADLAEYLLVLEAPDDLDILADITTKEMVTEVYKALEDLDPTTADIFKLKFILGYSNVEITEIMNLSRVNVGVKVVRGKNKLKAKMKSSGVTYDA